MVDRVHLSLILGVPVPCQAFPASGTPLLGTNTLILGVYAASTVCLLHYCAIPVQVAFSEANHV